VSAYVPSRLQLLALDFLIIFLQLVLTTIAYETSLLGHGTEPDTHDILLPIPTSPSPIFEPSDTSSTSTHHLKVYSSYNTLPYVIDLRLAPIIGRLRNSPQPPPTSRADTSLPLPNTTPWAPGTRSIRRTSSQVRREDDTNYSSENGTRIPGGLGI